MSHRVRVGTKLTIRQTLTLPIGHRTSMAKAVSQPQKAGGPSDLI
jgi:hypothetical protein